jgi:hypothetical protein
MKKRDAPPKLRVCDEVIPCFPHIGKQRLDVLVHETTGDRLDRLADLQNQTTDSVHTFCYYLSLLKKQAQRSRSDSTTRTSHGGRSLSPRATGSPKK